MESANFLCGAVPVQDSPCSSESIFDIFFMICLTQFPKCISKELRAEKLIAQASHPNMCSHWYGWVFGLSERSVSAVAPTYRDAKVQIESAVGCTSEPIRRLGLVFLLLVLVFLLLPRQTLRT